jgi:hypothetical protein
LSSEPDRGTDHGSTVASLSHGRASMATHSPAERRKAGAALRRAVPRSAHGAWMPRPDRADPVAILIEQGRRRIQELLPIRYGRMRADPFAFLRGAAAVMAADLAHTPVARIRMQACGDAHLANFGSYATPEGQPVFDINDFDETLPAPFEWDLKRLATSFVLSGRVAQCAAKNARALALTAARAYREHMAALAQLSPIEAWSRRIDLVRAIAGIAEPKLRDALRKRLAKVLESGEQHFGLVEARAGGVHIRANLPLVCTAWTATTFRCAKPSPCMPRRFRRTGACCCSGTGCATWRSRRWASAASGRSARSGC